MAINFIAMASGASQILSGLTKKTDSGLYAALGRAKAQRQMDIGQANLRGINDAIEIGDDLRMVADKALNNQETTGIRNSFSRAAVLDSSIEKLSQNARVAYLTTRINVSLADKAGQENISAIQKAISQSRKRGIGDIVGGLATIGGSFGGFGGE